MSASCLPDVQEAVWTALDAAAAVDVTVLWGPAPADDAQPAEFVAVGWGEGNFGEESEREWTTLPASSGHPLQENFTTRLVIETIRDGGRNLRPAYERAHAIADAVETVLGSDLTISGATWDSIVQGRRSQGFQTAERQGWRVFLTLTGRVRRSP